MSEHRIDHGGAELSAGQAANNKPSRREALHLGLQATLAGCFAGSMRSVGLSVQIEDGELARGEIARVELEDSTVESGTFEDLVIIDCHTISMIRYERREFPGRRRTRLFTEKLCPRT